MPVLFKQRGRPAHSAPRTASSQAFHRAESSLSRNTLASAGRLSRPPSAHSNLPPATWQQRYLNPKQWVATLKEIYRKHHIKYLIPLSFVALYMLCGAIVFYWIESGADEQRVIDRNNQFHKERALLVKRIEEVARDRAASRTPVRRKFVEEAVDHFHQRLNVELRAEPQWTFLTAMYFSGTIFTTIGYGDVACSTVWGRILTVVYAIVGIPIMLITLNDLGKFLYKSINDILAAYDRQLGAVRRLFKKTGTVTDVDKLEKGLADGGAKPTPDIEAAQRHVIFDVRQQSDELPLKLEVSGDTISLENQEVPIEIPPAPAPVIFQGGDETASADNVIILSEEEEALPAESPPPPRMPVLVAIGVTVGWIFVCAALFKIWEDWTYAESCYFMFISLATIGLGDVTVQRRDLMVLCFVFVIIGLSLVSMCINVIQAALEDLYKKLLMKLILDYQAKLAQGVDHKGASMGMMKMWGGSKTAKYLMPMLSAEKRRAVMEQIEEEAKETGLEIPPILEDLDKKTGMPKILTIATEKKADEETQSKVFQELVRQSDPSRVSREPSRSVQPNVIFYDGTAQTDAVIQDDKNDQTVDPQFEDLAVQTETVETVSVDEGIQTDSTSTPVQEQQTQTHRVETSDSESMTVGTSYSSSEIQTELVTTAEQELQTYVVSLAYGESQTELVETKNIRVQTPYPEFQTAETQTEGPSEEQQELKAPSTISKARRRIQRAFQSRSKTRRRSGPQPAMSDWKDVSGSEEQSEGAESSHESLDWDPYDGYHAEKQRPVKDLRQLFDKDKAKPK